MALTVDVPFLRRYAGALLAQLGCCPGPRRTCDNIRIAHRPTRISGDGSDRLSGRSLQPRRASVEPSDASKHRYNFADAPLGTFWAFPEPGHLFQNVCQSCGRAPPTE